jgi:hypothetical protein
MDKIYIRIISILSIELIIMKFLIRKLSFLVLILIIIYFATLILQSAQQSFKNLELDDTEEQGPGMKLHKNSGALTKISFGLIRPFLEARIDHLLMQNGFISNLESEIYANKSFNVEIIRNGNGTVSLHCGQNARVKMQGQEITLETSKGEITEALAPGMMGMKKNEIRKITAKSKKIRKHDKNSESFVVGLLDFWPEYPPEAEDLLIFSQGRNLNNAASCGNNVLVSYKIRKVNGSIIYQSPKPIKFQIGSRQVPLALELGIIDAQAEISRTIIAQPALLKITEEMLPEFKKIDFPPQEAVIIDLELQSIEKQIVG